MLFGEDAGGVAVLVFSVIESKDGDVLVKLRSDGRRGVLKSPLRLLLDGLRPPDGAVRVDSRLSIGFCELGDVSCELDSSLIGEKAG